MEITLTPLLYFPEFVFKDGTIAARKPDSVFEEVRYYSRDSGVTWQQYNRGYACFSAYGDDALAIDNGKLYRVTADGQETYIGDFDLRKQITHVGGDYVLYPYFDLFLLNIKNGTKTLLLSGSEGINGMFGHICQTPGKYWIGYSHGEFYEYANGNVRRHDRQAPGAGALAQILQLPDGTYIASFGRKPNYLDTPGSYYSRDGQTWHAFYDRSPDSPFAEHSSLQKIEFISGTTHFDGVYLLEPTSSHDINGNFIPGGDDLYRFPSDKIWNYAMRKDVAKYKLLSDIAASVPINCGGQILIATYDRTKLLPDGYGYYYTERDALIWKKNFGYIIWQEGISGRRLPDYSYLIGAYKTNSLIGTANIYIQTVHGIKQLGVTGGNMGQGKHIHIMTNSGEKVLYDSATPFVTGQQCCLSNGIEKRYLSLVDIR